MVQVQNAQMIPVVQAFLRIPAVFKNLFKTPESKLDVVCDADNCSYNEDHCCCAGKIDIRGEGACNCGETCCGTFTQS